MLKRLIINGLTVIASLALAILAAEFVARWWLADTTTTAAGYTRFDGRWKERVKRNELNELGYRERPYQTSKPAGVYRIAVLGDSITFGQGIDIEERYTNRLERTLNETGDAARYEVVQFAKPGWNVNHYAKVYARDVEAVDPDFVLLEWFVNDFELRLQHRPPVFQLVHDYKTHLDMLGTSVLYFLLNAALDSLYGSITGRPDYLEYLRADLSAPDSPAFREAAYHLDALLRRISAGGRGVGVVLLPMLHETMGDESYPVAFLHEYVLSECRRLAVPCVDTTDAMARAGTSAELQVNPFDRHYGPIANEVVARVAYEHFSAQWRAAAALTMSIQRRSR